MDTAWILVHCGVLSKLGVGDLHAMEAAHPALRMAARRERFAKNAMQLVVVPKKIRVYARTWNLLKVCGGMVGLKFES